MCQAESGRKVAEAEWYNVDRMRLEAIEARNDADNNWQQVCMGPLPVLNAPRTQTAYHSRRAVKHWVSPGMRVFSPCINNCKLPVACRLCMLESAVCLRSHSAACMLWAATTDHAW